MLSFFVFSSLFGLSCALGISNNVYRLNVRDFESYLRDKDIMLVDFYAPWCHHCQELSPELDAAADQMASKNQFVFGKVDCVNDGKELCQRFSIQGYPTLKLFKYGKYIGDYVGQRDRGALMQYVDSVATAPSQNAPLTSGVAGPAALAEAINYKPHAAMFASHHASPIQAAAPAIVPNYINQVNMHAKNPSLMESFYGSSQTQHPANAAAFLGGSSPPVAASPDSLQSKFGNLASLDIYRSKLKMIAAYKNYQRRLKEYRLKLTSFNKANVNPHPQSYAGAVTTPPRPGVNAFAQHQTYRGYYRPEALAAQNVQINRANPQTTYGVYNSNYPNQFASPYGYQAQVTPYYRSKMATSRRHRNRKHSQLVNKPQAAHYSKISQKQLLQQQQQQFHQNPSTGQQKQALNKPQAPQPVAKPALPSLEELGNPLKTSDTAALKDLKADIESAIQDALKNAVTKESDKTHSNPVEHVNGVRAMPEATTAHSDQTGSASGVEPQISAARAPVIDGGEGSGSGLKPDSK